MGNRIVGIPFIFTDLYDLPTLPCKSTLFTRFAVGHGVQVTIEVTPSRLNMMNKSKKNMKKVRSLIRSLYPPKIRA